MRGRKAKGKVTFLFSCMKSSIENLKGLRQWLNLVGWGQKCIVEQFAVGHEPFVLFVTIEKYKTSLFKTFTILYISGSFRFIDLFKSDLILIWVTSCSHRVMVGSHTSREPLV